MLWFPLLRESLNWQKWSPFIFLPSRQQMKWVNISGGGAHCVIKGNFAKDIKLKEGLLEQWDEWECGRKIPQLKTRQMSWQQRLSFKTGTWCSTSETWKCCNFHRTLPVLALSSSRLCHREGLQEKDKKIYKIVVKINYFANAPLS